MKKIFIFSLFTDNLGTKLMALLMALFTWFYINQEYTDRIESLDVPLKVDVAQGLIVQTHDLGNRIIETVKISLEGPRGILQDAAQNIICRHKVIQTNLGEGPIVQIVELKQSDFNLPNSIRIKSINPSKIEVVLMRETEKNLRIDTEKLFTGQVPKGYKIIEVKTEPSEILVKGPKHILHNRQLIPCQAIDISDVTRSFSRTGKIVESIDNLPVSTNDVFKITVTITEELVETTMKAGINVLLIPEFPFQVKAKPQEIEFKLKGPAESIKLLKKNDFNVFVNVASLYPNTKDVKPGSYPGVNVEFQLSEKAPRGIILAEPLKPVMIEISELPKPIPPPEENK